MNIPQPTTLDLSDPRYAVEQEGKRWYIFPAADGQPDQYISASTVTGSISIDDALMNWAGHEAMKLAFAELPSVVAASQVLPCGRTYHRCDHDRDVRCADCPCHACEPCLIRWGTRQHARLSGRRADEGTVVHAAIRYWTTSGGQWPNLPDEFHEAAQPYLRSFESFCDRYGIGPDDFLFAEETVINRSRRYAGTSDGAVRIWAQRTPDAADLVARILQVTVEQAIEQNLYADVLIDYKTKAKRLADDVDIQVDHRVQLLAYQGAEVVRLRENDTEAPMPHTDAIMLVQLRLDGAVTRPWPLDPVGFEKFCQLAEVVTWWLTDGRKGSYARAMPAAPKPPKPRASRARKATTTATTAAAGPGQPAKSTVAPAARPRARTTAERIRANVTTDALLLAQPNPQPTTGVAGSLFGDEIPF